MKKEKQKSTKKDSQGPEVTKSKKKGGTISGSGTYSPHDNECSM